MSFRNIVVGISGGVDSSVAALLLKKKGFNVIGVFLKNWDIADETGKCAASEDFEDAKYVCNRLKIPLHEVNFVKEYWNDVFMNFVKEYEEGLTPNPDILCNKYIKFKAFYDHAINNFNADALATGHYAKTSFGDYLENYKPGENVKLFQPKDYLKDQTFFLSQISQEALRKTMFPLGSLTKSEVKKIAIENGLEKMAKKPESMGICFIGSRMFQKFISEYVVPKPGEFINIATGKSEGVHNGIHHYTIGQRCKIQGLREALFVVHKNVQTSEILVASKNHPSLFTSIFLTEKPHWIAEEIDLDYPKKMDFKFQHVYHLLKCDLIATQGGLACILEKPLRAITRGQYAVFYSNSECIGSAKITGVGPSEFSLARKIETNNYEKENSKIYSSSNN